MIQNIIKNTLVKPAVLTGTNSTPTTFASTGGVQSKGVVMNTKEVTAQTAGGEPNLTETSTGGSKKPFWLIPVGIGATILTLLGLRKLYKHFKRKNRRR